MLRQPGDGIAGGVGMAEEEELHALLAVVEDELVGEEEGGDLIGEGTVLPGPVLLRPLEAVGPLRLEEGLAPLLGDDRRPELHVLHVPVGVIAVDVLLAGIVYRVATESALEAAEARKEALISTLTASQREGPISIR